MASIEPTGLSELVDHSIGTWLFHTRDGAGAIVSYPMLATCVAGDHRVWLVNEAAQLAWPVARPLIRGYLMPDLRLEEHVVHKPGYSQWWCNWLRAKLLPLAIVHADGCPASMGRPGRSNVTQEECMPNISTVGTFHYDGEVFAVEWHPESVRVTDASGETAALMRFKPGRVLGEAAPGSAAPIERLDQLRELAIGVLEAAAGAGRGPWAALDRPLARR